MIIGIISILTKWHYNRQQTTSLMALDLKRNMLSTIMFKNPPTEVCTQVLLSHCFLRCPWVGIFHLEKEVHLAQKCVTLCAGTREEKQWEEKFNGNLVEAEGQKCKKNACAFTWRVCKNVCIYWYVFPLYHRGKMTRTLPKKIVSLESLSG